MKQQLKILITQALESLNLPLNNPIEVDHPQDESHGDYATNIAMVLYPQIKEQGRGEYQNPCELAQAIADQMQRSAEPSNQPSIQSFSVAGPGFINITLSPTTYLDSLNQILQLRQDYGQSTFGAGKKVIVEYSSPNIAKPFTIGHLRSTIIGDAIANILKSVGFTVLRDNHLGDWGTQFGKQIFAIKEWVKDESEIENAPHPVKKLVELYVKFHQEADKNPTLNDKAREWFKKLENNDPEARRIWQKCIDWSWKEFSRIYKKLGVQFSPEFDGGRGLGESFFEDKMQPVIQEVDSKGYLKIGKDGAKLFFFPEDKFPPAMLLKKDGTTLYHTRDLATDKYRKDTYEPNLIVNEVGAEQTLYFHQLFEMEKLLGWFNKNQRVHIAHGLIRFKDKKMSTRKGDVIWLDEVLTLASIKARDLRLNASFTQSESEIQSEPINPEAKQIKDVDHDVSIGALKWNDLKGSPQRNILFDWDEVLNMKGNSGPYLQYTHARCYSVLQKSETEISTIEPSSHLTLNPEELSLLRYLPRYPQVVEAAAAEFAPHHICTYVYELSRRYNTFYNRHSILGSTKQPVDSQTTQFRLALTQATAHIIKNSLHLLGIKALKSM